MHRSMLLLLEPTVVIISIIQAITIMELLAERAMLSPKSIQELEQLLAIQQPLVWLVPMPPIAMAANLEWFAR